MELKANRLVFRVTLIYVSVAGGWILLSDMLLEQWVSDPEKRIQLSIFKGLGFVILTGGLLYQLLKYWLKRWAREAAQRQAAVAELQRSEQSYREIFNATNDAVFVHDAATSQILDVNEAMLRIYGGESKAAILTSSFLDLSAGDPPYTWVEAQRYMRLAIEAGPQVFEWRARKLNGERFWVEVSLRSSQVDGQGRILAVVRDITARKQAEDQARAFAQLSQRLSVSTDPHGAADAVTNTALELLNWDACFLLLYDAASDTVRELINKDTLNGQRVTVPVPMGLIHPTPTLRRVIAQGGQLVLRQNESDDIGYTHRFGDLSRVSLAMMYVPLRHLGQVTGFLSVQSYRRNAYNREDLATLQALADQCAGGIARIQAEAALAHERNLLRTLIDHIPDSIYVQDSAGRFLLANETLARRFGVASPAELLGKTDADFYPAEAAAHFAAIDREVFAGRALLNGEQSLLLPNGERKVILSTKVPLKNNQGVATAIVGIGRDITERKQAEAELKLSHEQYRRAIIAANAIPYQKDYAADAYVFMGEGIQDLTGYAPAELRSAVWREMILETVFLGEAAGLTAPEAIRRILAGELKGWQTDHRIRTRSGEIRWISDCSIPLFDAGGKYAGSIGIIQDITERKQAETTQQEALNRLQKIASRVPGMVYQFRLHPDGTSCFPYASEGMREIYRVSPEEVRVEASKVFAILHPDDYADIVVSIQKSAGDLSPWHHEYRVKFADGTVRWLFGNALPEREADGATLWHGFITDITERKRAEAQMNLQSSALTAAANAIAITDRNGKVEWVNPAYTQLTGYGAEEAVGSHSGVLKSGQQSSEFYVDLWATITAGHVWHGELVNKRKDGRLYSEDMTITPVRGADGQIAHFVAIKQDVSERRVLENRLQQAQKMEAIGTLAGGIAHDFNNILAAIFGNVYLLQQDTEGNLEAQENIAEILKAASRAKDLVQQILTFSRRREHSRQVIRLEAVIKEAMKFLRASLPAEIIIETQLAADAPAVLADPTQIYQVTLNLATNALHAMEGRPGHLAVTLDSFQPDEAFLATHPDFRSINYTRMVVADTGRGMTAKTMARIFEPFFTTKPVGKGTGLGLAVVHGIVQSLEGAMTVESKVGQGTTFRLYFPAQTIGAPSSVAAPETIACGHGQKILLLDDEPALTAMFQRLLVRLKYQVTISNHAREALARFHANPAQFDLVITDLTMPEVNGLEVARQLRSLRPELPVILVSGFSSGLTREQVREAGCFELLEKPVFLKVLADVLQRALAKT